MIAKRPRPPGARHLPEAPDPQLALYARDLKRAVDAERARSRELAAANARLQVLDRLKTDFLGFISHELRTPLNAMSAVDLFDVDGDPVEQAEVIDMIRSGYERLDRFILRGLEYFEWAANDKPSTSQAVDLALVVRRAAASIPALAEGHAGFRVSASGGACLARGEEGALVEVVRIVLENALKFSRGEAFVRVDLRAAGDKVTLTVTDRGVGFPPELAQELFRPFTISDTRHHQEGTGLSLALAKLIVEAHGGQIRAESGGAGKGASFTVELPAPAPPEQSP